MPLDCLPPLLLALCTMKFRVEEGVEVVWVWLGCVVGRVEGAVP